MRMASMQLPVSTVGNAPPVRDPQLVAFQARATSQTINPVGGVQPNLALKTVMHSKDYNRLTPADHTEFALMELTKKLWTMPWMAVSQESTPEHGMRVKPSPRPHRFGQAIKL